MTQNGPDVMARADEYARRVEEALADLPQGQRKQLLADLAAHLAEITDDGRPVVDQLGPPEEYARELRATADAPPAGSAGRRSRLSRPWRVGVIVALIAAVVLAVAVGAGVTVHRSSQVTIAVPGKPIGPAFVPGVTIPVVAGKSEDAAASALQALGFVVVRKRIPSSAAPRGTVLTTIPVAGLPVPRGSIVNLVISSGP